MRNFCYVLLKFKPLKIKITSRQEYEADFLCPLYRREREGLFFVRVGVGELNYLSGGSSVGGEKLNVYRVVFGV